MNEIEQVLTFWFGNAQADAAASAARNKLWYQSTPGADDNIRRKFGSLLRKAENRQLDDWRQTPAGIMALVILLDQFSRNVYRGTGDAFGNDALVLKIAETAIDQGVDQELTLIERAFLYHPFEHAESLAAQDRSVQLFAGLLTEATGDWQAQMQSFYDHAVMHRELIVQFGRFPHRNRLLERAATPEENAYLEDGGRTFGQ